MPPRDRAALLDIFSAARHFLVFTAGHKLETFLETVEVHSAVLYQFIVLGEAASRLSEEFREEHPVAPWQRMVGLRNVLTHRYDAVDLHEVWSIVQRDLPLLVETLRPLLPRPEA